MTENGGRYTSEEKRAAQDIVALLVAAEEYADAAHEYMHATDITPHDYEDPRYIKLWGTLGELCVVSVALSRRYGIMVEGDGDA